MARRKQEFQPHWRPDFRIPSTLPDIKIIRTGFAVNFVALTLVVVVAFMLFQREYRSRALSAKIQEMEQRIENAEPADKASLKLNEQFRNSAAHIEEIQEFYTVPLVPHDLLARFTEMQPEDLIFSRVTVSESVEKQNKKNEVYYVINLTGEVKDLRILNQFKKDLQEADFLAPEGFASEISESVQTPDAVTRIFPYRMSITMRPTSEKKKGAE